MATYPGMSLGGEVRESVSLDEDDLSDVEDEVFIRDGKNGYKFAEEVGVKRPLMAPRRKLTKSGFSSRMKNRPMCWSLCRPCCYIFSGLVLLIGLIALVVILVSLFPLPVDKLKNWLISKTRECFTEKLLPCSDLVVTDVWVTTLPKLTSESVVRMVDINADGVDDVIFGYGTGDNYNINPDIYCLMFFNIEPPCGGGLIAINGSTGDVLWRRWLPHAVFVIYCTVDVNGDGIFDCLATGKGGIFCMVDSRNGSIIWQFDNKYSPEQPLIMDIYMATYIPDQDNDGIEDILTAHTTRTDLAKSGHLILISGKTGVELKRVETPNDIETFYPPQILVNDEDTFVIFATGSPTSPGNLSIVPLHEVVQGYLENVTTLFEDQVTGIISPSVLVDITGDNVTDIIISLFNSTTIAINGNTFQEIWNFTIPNSETLSIPTPGYFNEDNITDFLIKYQTGAGFPVYYYSQAVIIDGKTGNAVYDNPVIDSVGSQLGGLTLSMEHRGLDWFLFWTADCKDFEGHQEMYEFVSGSTAKQQNHADICKLRFNSTMFAKLNALNQYDQPPGLEIYNSDHRWLLEYNNTISPVQEAKTYMALHPEFGIQQVAATSPMENSYKPNNEPLNLKHKDITNYRHKGSQVLDDEYLTRSRNMETQYPQEDEFENDYNTYPDMTESMNLYSQRKPIDRDMDNPNRDARSKNKEHSESRERTTETMSKTQKKNLADMTKTGVYGYRNVRNSKDRLLNDLKTIPDDILKETYFKAREKQLRKSKFEQRDLMSHKDKIRETIEIQKVIDEERKKLANISENLWTVESEKERNERSIKTSDDSMNELNLKKRDSNISITGTPRLTSVGALMQSADPVGNSIDLVFLTYWLPPVKGAQLVLEKDVQCISDKLKKALGSKEKILNYQKSTLDELFKKECIEERFKQNKESDEERDEQNENLPYYNQISRLNLGQMTVYRVRIECKCPTPRKGERCAQFLNIDEQGWPSYLGAKGDGIFKTKQ